MVSQVSDFLKKHPVAFFYTLVFVIAWAGRVPLALSSYGVLAISNPFALTFLFVLGGAAPTLAAIIAAYVLRGKEGSDALFAQFRQWRVGIIWYLLALFSPILVMLLGFYLDFLGPGSLALDWSRFDWVGLPFLFLSMFISYVWEEIGWRGFALPELERHGALSASLIMGLLAFLWHLPLSLNKSILIYQIPLVSQLIFHLAITIWFTWLYNNTGGSLLVVSIFHASLNAAAGLSMSLVGEGGFVRQYTPVTIIYLAVAVIITLVYGPTRLSRRKISGGSAS